jgi:lysozyme
MTDAPRAQRWIAAVIAEGPMRSSRGSFVASLLALAACGGADHRAGDFYSAGESGLRICAAGPIVEGLDVSKYEGSIDWNTVKGAGIGFGIARVSDGLKFPDATFDTNWAGMKSVGMVRGAYQYFEPAQDPIAQADMVLQKIGTPGANDLSPAIDVETMGGLSANAVVAAVNQWLAHVQSATGRRPIVYASPAFWNGLGDPTVAADLWIANWQVTCPSVPSAWSGWKFWQYTATGTVSGVPTSTNTDLDRFNGSMSDLLAYAGGGPPPPPPPCPSGTVPLGTVCPPPPPKGCSTTAGGAAGFAAVLLTALALRRRRVTRSAAADAPRC